MNEANNSLRVIHHLSEVQIQELTELYQNEWWATGRTVDQTRDIVANSTLIICLIDTDDCIVAFTRVLSDKVIKAIIFDVIVREDHRGQGLGDQLMHLIFNHDELKSVKHFELYCNEDRTSFYGKYDFRSLNDEIFYMRKDNKNYRNL